MNPRAAAAIRTSPAIKQKAEVRGIQAIRQIQAAEAQSAGRLLGADFFAGADTVRIARELIGCALCRRLGDGSIVRWVLTETEAYDGAEDKACHAHKGRTARTEIMFGSAGHCYVYLCYGVHWLLNFVTGPIDYPAAVLVRGAGKVMGPGRLTKALEIDKTLNAAPLAEISGIWVEARAQPVLPQRIVSAARIGVGYAGPDWANRPYRFTLTQ